MIKWNYKISGDIPVSKGMTFFAFIERILSGLIKTG